MPFSKGKPYLCRTAHAGNIFQIGSFPHLPLRTEPKRFIQQTATVTDRPCRVDLTWITTTNRLILFSLCTRN